MTAITPVSRSVSVPTPLDTKVIDKAQGVVQALVSVSGNEDKDGDVVVPGATSLGLARVTPKGVWSHDWDTPVAKTLNVTEVYPGDKSLPGDLLVNGFGAMRVDMQFNLDSAAGQEAFSQVKFFGDAQEWSVGYEVVSAVPGDTADAAVMGALQRMGEASMSWFVSNAKSLGAPGRFILDWTVYEYSPVLFGANGLTRTESTKTARKDADSAVLDRLSGVERAIERIVVHLGADNAEEPTAEPVEVEAVEVAAVDEAEAVEVVEAEAVEAVEPVEVEAVESAVADTTETADTDAAEVPKTAEETEPVEVEDPEAEKALLNLEQSINEVYGVKAGRVLAARNVQRLERAVGALNEMMDEVSKGTEGDEPKTAEPKTAESLADTAALMQMEMARALL